MVHLLKVMMFLVRVPVLSEKMYLIWPSSSFRVVVRASAGVSVRAWYILRSHSMKKLLPRRIISTLPCATHVCASTHTHHTHTRKHTHTHGNTHTHTH